MHPSCRGCLFDEVPPVHHGLGGPGYANSPLSVADEGPPQSRRVPVDNPCRRRRSEDLTDLYRPRRRTGLLGQEDGPAPAYPPCFFWKAPGLDALEKLVEGLCEFAAGPASPHAVLCVAEASMPAAGSQCSGPPAALPAPLRGAAQSCLRLGGCSMFAQWRESSGLTCIASSITACVAFLKAHSFIIRMLFSRCASEMC